MESTLRRAYLSLGSNLGDRADNLARALGALAHREGIALVAVSPVYETEPVGVENQPAFLNLAAEIETALAPLALLNAAKDIERALGRLDGAPWGPRSIDIDLVWLDGAQMTTPELELPHAEFRTRRFVLQPLADLAPDWRDPVTGKTVAELLADPDVVGRVERWGVLEPAKDDIAAAAAAEAIALAH